MRSFRTEFENPYVERDIIELEKKIRLFKEGKIDEERFRSLRLARGVYGQRQLGVQMIRIKIPFGKLNAKKLFRICEVSDEYSKGRLHITTRQDIQIHHVSLDRTPELWSELEKDEVTLREACGNTVRNVTASATAGIDPAEAFDPRPYSEATFKYFLRNPICQEMGRKFKISFSNTDKDTALSFMHDVGLIAKIKEIDNNLVHGFKVMVGGGLGSQARQADLYAEFVPADEIIPLIEAILRIFERFGERNRRMKARMKFMLKEWGIEKFKIAVAEELEGMETKHPIEYNIEEVLIPEKYLDLEVEKPDAEYKLWRSQNVILQNDDNYAIGVKVRLGDVFTWQARELVKWLPKYSGNEITLTIDQNLVIRHIEEHVLYTWYTLLKSIGLADIGYLKFNDLTACPGTDTCNLGIFSSTGLSNIIEQVISDEYADLLHDKSLGIKTSGCMNTCGQHMIASIGFQGMSMKSKDKRVLPATQIALGGGNQGSGIGKFADKVIKIPSKRTPQALRFILDDYKINKSSDENFLSYYERQGEKYFYSLLKELGNLDNLKDDDFIDWGHNAAYIKAIGVGECAGVVVDLISTLFFESEEKLELAARSIKEGQYQDGIYHTYSAIVNTAKAILTSEDHKANSQMSVVNLFDTEFAKQNKIYEGDESFVDFTYKYRKAKATEQFAISYLNEAKKFYLNADQYRKKALEI
jgi:sulfite reductase (ferredoxin)